MCSRVLVRVWEECVLDKEKAGAAPSWAPPGNNWFHSFMPSLLMSISSASALRPSLGGWGQLGTGHTPVPALEKHKAIPSGKCILWKRHCIW